MKQLYVALMGILALVGLTAHAHKQVVVVPMGGDTPATSKLLFMTNGEWMGGEVGGELGADTKCSAEALSRGYSGTFKALIAVDFYTPTVRSNHYSLTYKNPDGDTLRSSFHSLFWGLDNPIHKGSPSDNKTVWTGLNADLSYKPQNCNNWTSSSGAVTGGIGYSDQYSTSWVDANEFNCDIPRHLYCIEQ